MFHGRMVPVTIERGKAITLKNFSIDWIRSFHAELTVVESDERTKSFIVQTDREKYPYTIAGGKFLIGEKFRECGGRVWSLHRHTGPCIAFVCEHQSLP